MLNLFYFSILFGMFRNLTEFFSNGSKPPTSLSCSNPCGDTGCTGCALI